MSKNNLVKKFNSNSLDDPVNKAAWLYVKNHISNKTTAENIYKKYECAINDINDYLTSEEPSEEQIMKHMKDNKMI